MGRSPCCSKVGLRRGPWSTKEDTLLTNYIQEHGEGQWRSLPKKAGKNIFFLFFIFTSCISTSIMVEYTFW